MHVIAPHHGGPASPWRPEITRFRESSAHRTEKLDLSYTDESGRAFRLSIERETTAYSLTYDRRAHLAHRHGHHRARGLALGRRRELAERLREVREEDLGAHGVKRLLHRLLQASNRDFGNHFRGIDPLEAQLRSFEAQHVELTAVSERVTLSMDTVDPEYWSAENTAGRIADFAAALYRGGDRGEHYAKMVDGMERGYDQARQALGGSLPAIARETLERARSILAEWVEEAPEALDLVA